MVSLKTLLVALEGAGPETRARVLDALPAADIRAIEEEWGWQAHGGQREPLSEGPGGDWRVWLMIAGRGFGKTRAGAEWVWARAREGPEARIALVGASIEDAVRVMIEGESGLIATARTGETPRRRANGREIVFPSGAIGFVYSGANPNALRGPQHHFAWCDELAKWRYARAAWDNLEMGMRLGERPRILVTTTPAASPVLRAIAKLPGIAPTGGRMAENAHLAGAFVGAMTDIYGGTRLGRQELDGELLEDSDGTLWPREMIERWRGFCGEMRRVVVGVDPPASAAGGCGIVVCGLGRDGVAYVLADCTIGGARPEGWARAVAGAAEAWSADRVIAEKNNGGDMVESVLRAAAGGLPVTLVSASRGKVARAEPVATAFEAGKARFAGRFPELEDELNGMTANGGYVGAGSPDRADAMVWALTELVVKQRAEPRIMVL